MRAVYVFYFFVGGTLLWINICLDIDIDVNVDLVYWSTSTARDRAACAGLGSPALIKMSLPNLQRF
jgi:hypothetical protein